MNLEKAMDQLTDIHAQIARTEYYHGFRALPVAASGLCALLAALVQPMFVESSRDFVLFWVVIALFNAGIMLLVRGYGYCYCETAFKRQQSLNMFLQFMPCLFVGAALAAFSLLVDNALMAYLPGLWSMTFALGIFACRPYLPSKVFWVGVFYLVAGCLLLLPVLHWQAWGMGLVFGVGQIFVAFVLYWDLERLEMRRKR